MAEGSWDLYIYPASFRFQRSPFLAKVHLFADDQDVHMRQQTLKVSLKMFYVETIVKYVLR